MQSIIMTFNDNPNARRAIERLVGQGFDRSSIHLQPAYENAPATSRARPSLLDPFGFAGAFSTLFGAGPKEAVKYAEAVRRGNSMAVLDAEDEQLEEAVTAYSQPQSQEELDLEREDMVMPVVQEELQVGKRSVQGGGVRIVKRMTEAPVSEDVTLREEHATFVRRPADRAATESDFENFKEGVVEVREMSEQVVVGKSARIVEEVHVRKGVTERTETVSDTVRRTDVDVERVPAKATAPRVESLAVR